MRLRLATEADLAAVGELTVAAYAEFMAGPEHAGYREQLRDPGPRFREAELWVAEREGSLLGTVVRCPLGSPWREVGREDEGEFRMLAVAPAARGLGVGETLVRHCEARFAQEGLTAMALSTLPEMVAAHRLYERLGYARVEHRDWSPAPGVTLWVYGSRPMNRSASTTTRVTSPEPTSFPASVAETANRTSRPST